MTETVQQWIDKAEGDYGVAQREIAVDALEDYGPVCFHAQQCVEKLIKAAIIQRGVAPPYIHDLVRLSRMLHSLEPSWQWDEIELVDLTDSAVDDRYPGTSATREDAQQMFELCERLRASLLELLESGA